MPATLLLLLRLAMALVLYAFLAWVFVSVWVSLKRQSEDLASQRIPPLRLVLEEDEDQLPIEINRPTFTLGRNPTCDYVLEDDTVSSFHLQVFYRNKQWWLEDLNSTNGTFLNEQRVQTATVLTSQDRLRAGQVGFQIQIKG